VTASGEHPPPGHVLDALGIEVLVDEERAARARLETGPHVAGPDGSVRTGVVATLVGVVGGAIGARLLRPDRMATADLTVHRVGGLAGPLLEASGSVVRRGRSTMVVRSEVRTGPVGDAPLAGEPAAVATTTFAVLPERGGDEASSAVVLPFAEHVRGSSGALQGGMAALVAEASAASALGAALGRPATVADLHLTYLAVPRVGPVTASAEVLVALPGARWGTARVVLVDGGDAGRPVALASAVAVAS
jgi:acyl-coenzyme A thioesterase PaaI-like protein